MEAPTPHEFQDLLTLYVAGELSAEQKVYLQNLVRKDSQAQSELDEVDRLWSITGYEREEFHPDTQAALQNLLQEIGEVPAERFSNRLLTGRNIRYLSLAASVTLLVIVGILNLPTNSNGLNPQPAPQLTATNHVIQVQGPQIVTLPDGSRVTLGGDSRLEYVRSWGDKRRSVSLQGNARFDVARDTTRPFQVVTANSETQVLGTSFTIDAWPEMSSDEIWVHSGQVRFAKRGTWDMAAIFLGQNDCASLMRETGQLEKTRGSLSKPQIAQVHQLKETSYDAEAAAPAKYLIPSFEINTNLFRQTVIRLSIQNAARLASFSHIIVEVKYTTRRGERRQTFKVKNSVSPDGIVRSKHRLKDWFVASEIKSVLIKKAKVSRAR